MKRVLIRRVALMTALTATATMAALVAPPAANAASIRAGTAESVADGSIAWSNRDATKVVMTNGTQLTVPVSLPGVVHTELNHGRPVKAYYETRDGRNTVTLMFVEPITPGGGG